MYNYQHSAALIQLLHAWC